MLGDRICTLVCDAPCCRSLPSLLLANVSSSSVELKPANGSVNPRWLVLAGSRSELGEIVGASGVVLATEIRLDFDRIPLEFQSDFDWISIGIDHIFARQHRAQRRWRVKLRPVPAAI